MWKKTLIHFLLLGAKLLVHLQCGTTTITHSKDNCGTATHDITAGIEVANARLHSLFVNHDGIATANVKSLN